ncbi:MAG: GTP cyclohydrolase I FolE [Alphaproteobacteria bacterium]|nr:GTP cyclohydrolase I FolE [Alphaproteobacteria bacterium]
MTVNERNGITRTQAEQAVRTLIQWAGDDPAREGLLDTPARVARAWEDFCIGYQQNADEMLQTTFAETENYHDIILLKDIRFESHCEHHLVPIIGHAHIAYVPQQSVVGISKLARVVDCYAKRLQLQERMTMQIAQAIMRHLKPLGVAVAINSDHHCMNIRGVYKPESDMFTLHSEGCFQEPTRRQEFLRLIGY